MSFLGNFYLPQNPKNATNCPYCFKNLPCKHNNFATKFSEISKEWDFSKNEKEPDQYSYGSQKLVSWICKNNTNHKWESTIKDRSNGTGCPYCINKTEMKIFDQLSLIYPKLARNFSVE